MPIQIPDRIGSYDEKDVVFVLKDISQFSLEKTTEEREQSIQSNTMHYSEMLPIEYEPPAAYMEMYESMLQQYAEQVAKCTAIVAEKIKNIYPLKSLVLVSLARAGTPIGILIKRYFAKFYHIDIPHYSISIIRGRGIDENALQYILQQHPGGAIQFIDGWTGKGAIARELNLAVESWNAKNNPPLSPELAVLADPGHCTTLYGTREDFLIPSACLNSTVSGLVSRTVLNTKYLQPNDFHGAKYYRELEAKDVSKAYIEAIVKHYHENIFMEAVQIAERERIVPLPSWAGEKCIEQIQRDFQIQSVHHIKPGVGETTRVLLRRIPWKILVHPDKQEHLAHIFLLAKERGVEIEPYEHMTYSCCGLIKEL